MKLNQLANVATGVLVVCALVMTGLFVRRELAPAATAPQARTLDDWQRYASDGHRMGPAAAAVTITEFSDFECPYCRVAAHVLAQARERYPTQLAVVFRHMPLHSHKFAIPAARASECAADQQRFEAMHDRLFAWQDSLGLTPWARFASAAGVADSAAFDRCMGENRPVAALARDTAAARQLGIRATPTMLINDQFIVGTPTASSLDQLVQRTIAAGSR